MGDFRFEFQSVGGHGCDRTSKEGQALEPCRKMGCPDCEVRRFVEHMASIGMKPKTATFTHWPGEESEVVDDLAPPPAPDVAGFYASSGRVPPARRARNDFQNSNPRKPAT